LLAIVIAIFTLSFVLNINGSRSDAISAFYSPQTRFWELLVGSILAYAALFKQNELVAFENWITQWSPRFFGTQASSTKNNSLHNIVSTVGVIVIVAGILLVTDNKHYPGFWALLPTLGSALIIAAGSQAWFNRRVLANKAMVWIGLISFPLYLWHWPLLSFTRIFETETPKGVIRLEVVIGSIVLSYLTYVVVERPIRFGKNLKQTTVVLLTLMGLVGGLGFAVYKLDGIGDRKFAEVGRALFDYRFFFDFAVDKNAFWGKTDCFNLKDDYHFFEGNGCEQIQFANHQKVFLLGDSYSAFLSPGLRSYLTTRELNFFQYSTSYCIPFSLRDSRERCIKISRHILEQIKAQKPEILIIFINYLVYPNSPEYNEAEPFEDFILKTTDTFKNLGVKKVITPRSG